MNVTNQRSIGGTHVFLHSSIEKVSLNSLSRFEVQRPTTRDINFVDLSWHCCPYNEHSSFFMYFYLSIRSLKQQISRIDIVDKTVTLDSTTMLLSCINPAPQAKNYF